MKPVLLLNKPIGISPLDAIKRYQSAYPEYAQVKLGVAGRLDPMADGLLIVLVGDENKKRKNYERLSKEYTFSVLFGIETDSYDILGKITHTNVEFETKDFRHKIEKFIQSSIGKKMQEYPPYSAPRVNGKPLFWWAREGRIDEIVIPKKEIKILKFELTELSIIKHDVLIDTITHSILQVNGIFRQEEILAGWIKFFKNSETKEFLVADFTISCTSGTYIRSIADEMGKILRSGAIAKTIRRIKIGEYILPDAISV